MQPPELRTILLPSLAAVRSTGDKSPLRQLRLETEVLSANAFLRQVRTLSEHPFPKRRPIQ
jgi:hypothetical protein